MTPRAPVTADLPNSCTAQINSSADGKDPANALLMLHGMGDNAANFGLLGRRMNLPETVSIALQAPAALPFDLGGYHWGDDIIFDQDSGQMDMDTGFTKSSALVDDVIQRVLVGKCGFRHRQIHLFGLGQGGMVALNVARAMRDKELGSIVSLGGPLPATKIQELSKTARTPVLVLHGSSRSSLSVTAVKTIKDAFSVAAFHQWSRPGDGMPTSRDEMLPIMQFLASRYQSLAGVPPGAQQIG